MAPFKNLGDKLKGTFTSFNPTEPSARLTKTYGEVQAFKRQLVKAEAGLKLHAKATEELLRTVDETITAFPRVWSKADDGVSASLHEEDHLKPDPQKHKLASYPSNSFHRTLETDLREEVYLPIERWHAKYREIKGRIGEVENTRLDYDKARAKVAEVHKAALKHAAKTDSKIPPAEQDVAVRQAEAALTVTREEYVRIEEAVHVELAVLVMDAQNALDFVTRALTLEARALMDVASHHQQETVKSLPMLITESSGPLLLGPASPANSVPGSPASPLLLGGGSPINRSYKQSGSPLSTGGSPVGATAAATSPLGGPPATPEQVVGGPTAMSREELPREETRVVSDTVREVPAAVVTPAIAVVPAAAVAPATPPRTDVTEEQAEVSDAKAPDAVPGAHEADVATDAPGDSVDTPFGPATVNVSFDEKRAAFLQEHAA